MIPRLTPSELAVQYPADRRLRILLSGRALGLLALAALGPFVAAWIQFLACGLPPDPNLPLRQSGEAGFPGGICLAHWANFLFLTLLVRSGLSILMDHPRLYWNDHCAPGSEWIRLTPLEVPRDRVWTAKDDARYLTPILGLPGYRHTIGLARVWHFSAVPFFLINGGIFVGLLFLTHHGHRLVPETWTILPRAWDVFVYYATFHLPAEPNGFYQFNPLQQLSYFSVVFVMAPLSMLTGLAMSPAIESRFPWYRKLFGGRQGARSLHFLLLLGYLGFTAAHVSMVALTGLRRNMNHITRNADDDSPLGIILGFTLMGVTAACWLLAHWLSWRRPRVLQHLSARSESILRSISLNSLRPRDHYSRKDISPFFWPNGKLPTSEEWIDLAKNGFKSYKLKIGGLVNNPVELSLEDLRRMGKEEHITMHHCIQGWTGHRRVGRCFTPENRRPCEAEAKRSHRGLLFLWRWSLWWQLLRHPHLGQPPQTPSHPGVGDERSASPTPLWSADSAEGGESTRLQDGQMDPVHRFRRIPQDSGQRRRGKNEDDEYFDLSANI